MANRLLVFVAQWATPCNEMKASLEKLKSEGFDIKVLDIDTTEGSEQALELNVKSVPTTYVFHGDAQQKVRVGLLTEQQLIGLFK